MLPNIQNVIQNINLLDRKVMNQMIIINNSNNNLS